MTFSKTSQIFGPKNKIDSVLHLTEFTLDLFRKSKGLEGKALKKFMFQLQNFYGVL